MSEPTLLVEQEGAVSVIVLNRPDALNALSAELRRALAGAIRAADADPAVRAIVLTGAGDRAFSAGVDLKELGTQVDGVFASDGFDPAVDPAVAMAACRTPIVGAVNGVAITGALELALACDILICSENARFADTHVKVEVVPGWGLSQRLSRQIGASRAKEMSLTGMFVDAATAVGWGLVNRVVPLVELRAEAIGIATAIAAHNPMMVARYKALIDAGFAKNFGDAMAYERDQSAAFNAQIGGDAIERRYAGVRESNRG